MNSPTELNISLDGQTISAATSKLKYLAQQMDYRVIASGPSNYQLVRQRRQMVRRRTESMTLAFVEDRSGPRVRIIGDIDPILVEHLTGRPILAAPPDFVMPHPPAGPPQNRVFSPPQARYELSGEDARPVRPAAPAVGLISSVPGASPVSAPAPERSAPIVSAPPPAAGVRGGGVVPVVPPNENDDRTLKRVVTSPPNPSLNPVLVASDGTMTQLVAPLVIGRNPDPLVGPAGAVAMVIDNPTLSKSHCVVRLVGGGLTVLDLHSTNGTTIETDTHTLDCIAGQESPIFPLPIVVCAGDVRFEALPGAGGPG